MPQSRTNFEVTIEKLVYGGDGLARRDGQIVLVPFVLPGEQVLAAPESEKKNLLRAKPVEVRVASPERTPAPCPYFGACGGCHYQHATYNAQLEAKIAVLAEELRRIGKLEPPDEIRVVAGDPWNYRNRSQFHIRGTHLGYLQARSHKLCGIEFCPISSHRINGTIAILRSMLRDGRWPRFVQSLEVFTNESDVQLTVLESEKPVARRFFDWCAETIPGWSEGPVEYPAAGSLFRVSSRSFFQVNRYLIDPLVETALDGAGGEAALDLYAGVGLFSIPLARRFARVTAVESGGAAVRDLVFNAERAGAPVSAQQAGVDEYLSAMDSAPDLVLADPPRAGLGKAAVSQLIRLKPPAITIVSCDPATLARDLAPLVQAGYSIAALTMVDLFPQTYHFETIAQLRMQ